MLRELQVSNLAVLAGATVEFAPGFNALTGETGAGKSIVVDSLALLAGARASSDLIRTGASSLTVTGAFRPVGDGWRHLLTEAGLEADGPDLLVRREIQREGRNRVFLNDQPATLRLLAELGPSLLRIHGQREELGLATPDLQREWLDRSGGAAARALLDRVGALYQQWSHLESRRARRQGDDSLRRERLEFLRFQAAELDAARLVAGEDDSLRAERDVLRHVEAIATGLGAALEESADAEGSAVERLARAAHALAEIERWDASTAPLRETLEQARVSAADVAGELRHRLASLEADPARLDLIEDRLAQLERLQRKYGANVAAMLERQAAIAREVAELEGSETEDSDLEAKTAAALAHYAEAARELSSMRREWGARLARRIVEELRELALARARFVVDLETRSRADSPLVVAGRAVEFGAWGIDQVVFRFSPNPGEDVAPLQRAASGGELSRVYLALQLATGSAGADDLPVLVFDEIDAGIGGAEGAALGTKLRRLAAEGRGQVLIVTHLAPVASQADAQFRVHKRVEGDRTIASVEALDGDQRVQEIARMLAGAEVTAVALTHAQELLATVSGRRSG